MAYRQVNRSFGTCINFDGSATRITIADNSAYSFGTGEFMVSCWVRTTNFGANRTVAYAFGASTNNGWQAGSNGAGKLVFNTYVGGADQALVTSPEKIDTGNWTHLVFGRSGKSNVMYINGVLVGTTTGSTVNVNNTDSKFIGCNLTPAKFFLGQIDDVRFYNTALTATQITNLFYGMADPGTTNLKLWYKLDEGSGTSATDSSATANNGTITSGVYSGDVFM